MAAFRGLRLSLLVARRTSQEKIFRRNGIDPGQFQIRIPTDSALMAAVGNAQRFNKGAAHAPRG
jgi:hypothetical protein